MGRLSARRLRCVGGGGWRGLIAEQQEHLLDCVTDTTRRHSQVVVLEPGGDIQEVGPLPKPDPLAGGGAEVHGGRRHEYHARKFPPGHR